MTDAIEDHLAWLDRQASKYHSAAYLWRDVGDTYRESLSLAHAAAYAAARGRLAYVVTHAV